MTQVLLTPDRWRRPTREMLERITLFNYRLTPRGITEIVLHFTDGEIEKRIKALETGDSNGKA